MKIVLKRLNKGIKNNIFLSGYYTSYKYGAIAIIHPTETHFGGINCRTFKTKKEAEDWNPKYPGESYENMEEAKKVFEDVINQYNKHTNK
jgi:hypothetical protein